MARRRPKPRPGYAPPDFLTIRFDGPPGCGKSTALEAVRLLLADAGFRVDVGISRRADDPAADHNLLMVRPDRVALDELRDWMKGEPA